MADIQKINVNGESYDIDDPNDVEKEDGELADTVINYESATTPTIGSFTQFLDRFVSGTKVGAWFKNFRAGCEFLLHIGSLVNNCVSDNEALPLAAAQGKVLMDLITDANATIEENKSSADSGIADLQSQVTQINNDLSDINSDLGGVKFVGDGYYGNAGTITVQLESRCAYLIIAWHRIQTSCCGVYLAVAYEGEGGIVTFHASSHLSSISISDDLVLTAVLDNFGGGIRVFLIGYPT